ncbi:MAG: rRNA maturation RNase YbeY [Betaproteobacteria bacterium]|nr:rRNA maturation RNase YbeY [Betaproteobacteria bacterium]
MTLTIASHQRKFPVDRKRLSSLVRQLLALAQRRTPGVTWQEVAIHLLDDAGIAPINEAVMGHTGATDVITQRYDSCPGEPEGLRGELFVNVERAFTVPRRKQWTAEQELALYLAHGLDHLTGADDATPSARATMRRRELAWLRKGNAPDAQVECPISNKE